MANVKFLNTSISLAANFNSDTWDVTDLKDGSMQVSWTGANATDGVLKPQISNDGLVWDEADDPSPAILIDAATGSHIFNFRAFPFRYVRLNFVANTNTAGTLVVRTFGTDKNLGWK